MTTVFHAWSYGRFIEIQNNLSRKKLPEQNKAQIFLEAILAIEIMQESQSSLEKKVNPSNLKLVFLQEQTHPFSHQYHQCY